MKKIERKKVLFLNDNGEMDGHVAVLESDLDELEQENKLFYENWQTFVAIANEQRIARVAIRQQRDEAVDIVVDNTRALEDSGREDLVRWTRNILFLENVTGQTWEEIKAGKRW